MKCGVEVHAQLNTQYKLFSLSRNSTNATPNSHVSFYDCGLPGSQPKLNPEALLLALKAAVALDCDIQHVSTFDRKHYFYPDLPNGYQITQQCRPIAKGGRLDISASLDYPKSISLQQIQLEQDTGKTTTTDQGLFLDYNRSNVPLIEIVTRPDFTTVEQVCAFAKTLQCLLRHLNVCSGELESGAMRIDVNVSVNDHERVEIKNLRSFRDVENSIMFEYRRQVNQCLDNQTIARETRSWNGHATNVLRLKADSLDYRFMPDPELESIVLDPSIAADIRSQLPELPSAILHRLTSCPGNLPMKYAQFLVNNLSLLQYYDDLSQLLDTSSDTIHASKNNLFFNNFIKSWSAHSGYGNFAPSLFAKIIMCVANGDLTASKAGRLVAEIVQAPLASAADITKTIADYVSTHSSSHLAAFLTQLCQEIIDSNAHVVAKIRDGKKNSMMHLVGIAMKRSRGTLDPKKVLAELERIIHR